ncbi:hypothetical protein [Haploplasma axanthum]|uniref:Uncharacterized protein n=1 Tax=Haploplasma axanthum TaxID=29552 RepID=A0A449BGE3_HAPAX|nr:hypothetical protein [Haploplasma axanthum]VEU79536.1 Uncharacterised protein [Haploplasma axanthum]VEU81335.1 Uncharacterised protein [Haploplasma axanthum]VEU81354.1 Uncharacterised protein [Haploplasma axanthum]VEU81371.1 Uncharacterised protein [Haploplasma axanthum]
MKKRMLEYKGMLYTEEDLFEKLEDDEIIESSVLVNYYYNGNFIGNDNGFSTKEMLDEIIESGNLSISEVKTND